MNKDTIYRQAAIDGLGAHYINHERRHLNEWQEGWNSALDWVRDVYLDELPSSPRSTVDKEYLIDLIQEAVYDGEACAKLMDMVDRPQGKWIYPTDIIGFGRCGSCGSLWDKSLIDNIFFKYCPKCGSRQTMIKCNTCEYCDVNTNSDEAYCEANDGEQIILYRGQCRPRWCPRNIQGKHADFVMIDEAAVKGADNE